MLKKKLFSFAITVLLVLPMVSSCGNTIGDAVPHTDRTAGLVKELLAKLDSTDVYTARKEKKIETAMSLLPGSSESDRFEQYCNIAGLYSKYQLDSALCYLDKAVALAAESGLDSLCLTAKFVKSLVLSKSGFSTEALEVLETIPRSSLRGDLFPLYYNSWTEHYHFLYNGYQEPAVYREQYRAKYNLYRDSLLTVLDPADAVYLRNIERKEARAGNYDEARRYNAIRLSSIRDKADYASCIYDRFMISFYYEGKLKGVDVDDLLESAILELEDCNYNIASLLRVEAFLIEENQINAAKKISDYYYSSLRKLGSRQRLMEGGEQSISIYERYARLLQRKNDEFKAALFFISFLLIALLGALLIINNNRIKIIKLKDDVERSGKISKRYIGVLFKLYSSYIRRLDVSRTKIHSLLKKGKVQQALELTSPLGGKALEERKDLFRNFDTTFVDIFPTFINTVNSCLRPEERIVPKRTEILNSELRILALIKLGIADSSEIADLLHCSVKTVYNLRSVLKTRLAVPEEDFIEVVSNL